MILFSYLGVLGDLAFNYCHEPLQPIRSNLWGRLSRHRRRDLRGGGSAIASDYCWRAAGQAGVRGAQPGGGDFFGNGRDRVGALRAEGGGV